MGEGSKAIGFDAKELERSRGLSCRTDSIYLWALLIILLQLLFPPLEKCLPQELDCRKKQELRERVIMD